ncbi:glycosyltransferase family 61 protein [Aureimonas sp. ME7]|uniref:glycosyltransferase 61 family protein n=1 Tax=Aureimonas sp. ME7 TaxID=2744252 RepID=UPI0015F516B0|nr:glycosyltransferase family 61 protein [Aureimonas sp. ME7]
MERDIPYVCLKDAEVQAFVAPIVQHPIGYRGGPLLHAPELAIFRHHRAGGVVDNFGDALRDPAMLNGDHTYAGAMYDHFGHFMAEMVHRIVPARLAGLPDRYLFVGAADHEANASFDRLPQHIRDILAFLDLGPDNVTIAIRDLVVERLHLVPQAAEHHGDPPGWYLEALRSSTERKLDALFGDRERPPLLYVSRANRALEGGLLGEAHVELWLRRAGFVPFYPEEHPFAEQMDHYRKARCVVFTQGSACHGTELMGTGALKNVLLIPKSIKAGFFERILAPRSHRFATVGQPNQIGTMYYDRNTGFQHIHLGVSLVDLDALRGSLSRFGIDIPAPGRWAYRRAAFRDLLRYLRGASEAKGRDRPQALRLARSFASRILFRSH